MNIQNNITVFSGDTRNNAQAEWTKKEGTDSYDKKSVRTGSFSKICFPCVFGNIWWNFSRLILPNTREFPRKFVSKPLLFTHFVYNVNVKWMCGSLERKVGNG